MMTSNRRVTAGTASALGYLLLLMAFAALGLSVAALAVGSGWAAILGMWLILCMAGSVTGFRAASRRLARFKVIAEATSPVSIFSTPLHRHEIDRYLENYRGKRTPIATQKRGTQHAAKSVRGLRVDALRPQTNHPRAVAARG